jgi:Ca2+-binding RTX toxin-like protein
MWGGAGDDRLEARGATNWAFGDDGDDRVVGLGAGENRLWGGSGDDHLEGRAPFNQLKGDRGDDVLEGFGAHNEMYGFDGADVMEGWGALNRMRGEGGDDRLLGHGAVNEMWGGTGDDRLEGWAGENEMSGGAGHDVIVAHGGANIARGGTGDDRFTLHAAHNEADGEAGDDTFLVLGVSNVVRGGAGDDELEGGGNANVMWGGAGADALIGAGVANVQHGDGGDDRLYAGGAGTYQHGGSGDDRLFALAAVGNYQFGDAGADTVVGGGGHNVQSGGGGADTLFAAGALNVQLGAADRDVLVGVGGSNFQHGGAGDDLMFGELSVLNVQVGADGDDVAVARGGGNVQFGDHLWSALPSDLGFDRGLFADVIAEADGHYGVAGGGDNVLLALGKQNFQFGGAGEDLALGAGLGNVQMAGGAADLLVGAGVANGQYADAGGDIVVGGGQAALQFAGAGDDVLLGAAVIAAPKVPAAANVQQGGAGRDVVFGGAWRDPLQAGSDIALGLETGADPETGEPRLQLKTPADLVLNVQHAGAHADLVLGMGANNVQFADAGADLVIGAGHANVVDGGADGDFVLAGLPVPFELPDLPDLPTPPENPFGSLVALGNHYLGGAGDDFVMSWSAVKALLDERDALVDLPVDGLEAVESVGRRIETEADRLFGWVDDLTAPLEALDPLGAIGDALATLPLEDDRFYGGAGDDVLSGGAADDRLIGSAGDDLYVLRLGEGGDVVDEHGAGAFAGAVDRFGEDVLGDADAFAAPGGDDVVEIRTDSVATTKEDMILARGLAGDLAFVTAEGTARVAGMDDADTRVETLRLVGRDGVEEFDLVEAYAATAIELDDVLAAIDSLADGAGFDALGDLFALDLDAFRKPGTAADTTSDLVLHELAGHGDTARLFAEDRVAWLDDRLSEAVATTAATVGLEPPPSDGLIA